MVRKTRQLSVAWYLLAMACTRFASTFGRLRRALRATDETARRLAASERRYRALVESQSDIVALSTVDGRLTFVNAAYASLFGRLPEQMIGTSLFDYIPPDERHAVAQHLATLCANGGVATGENRMLAVDGSGPRMMSWVNRALLDAEGVVDCIHSVGRDITEQKTLETQFLAAAQEIEDLYDNAPCGYHSVGANGTYIKVNATELAWLGCRADEVQGKLSPRDFLVGEDKEALTRTFVNAKLTGQPQKLDCRLIGRHGIERDVSIRMTIVLDDDGTFLMTRSVMFDVSAQKEAERALKRVNDEQQLILESELFGIAKIRARRYLWANAGFSAIFGCAKGDLDGVPTRNTHVDDAAFDALGARAYSVLQEGGTFRGELEMRRRDGSPIWIEATARLLDADSGESLWMMKDITERRQAEVALRRSESLLERTGVAAGVGGWEFDLHTRVVTWTAETRRIHGVVPEFQPDLDTALAFYEPESRAKVLTAIDATVAGGPSFDLELKIRRADDTRPWVRVVGHLESSEGRPARLVGAFQDVSTKVEQIEQIEQLYQLADQQREELEGYRDKAEAEAELAGFLLSNLSRIAQLDAQHIQYFWKPAEAFSGDIIAVAESAAGDTYGLLADATGHGLAAAINLIPLTSAFYAMAAKGFNLVTISEQLNEVVKDYSLPDRFVAVTLARFQRRSRQLEIVNAGNPAALLVDAHHQVVREFVSGSIPLGILDRPNFHPSLETVELRGDESLLMFSDGLVEANDLGGKPFARAGVIQALRAVDGGQTIAQAIENTVKLHAAGLPFADDVSVLVMPAARFGEANDAQSAQRDRLSAPARDESPPSEALETPKEGCWSVELRLSSTELKHIEAVPVIVQLTRTFGLSRALDARLFTVLSELFQNALEHGVLGLDSKLKGELGGLEDYLALRASRLAALSDGEVVVRLHHQASPSGAGRLRISVRDSGSGFDHVKHLNSRDTSPAQGSATRLCGRGIHLLLALCEALTFNASGNEATVELAYD